MKRTSHLIGAAGAAAMSLVLSVGLAPAANADWRDWFRGGQSTGDSGLTGGTVQNGAEPTQWSIEARRGPFNTAQERVSDLATSGFGSANIWYPTDTSKKYGVVAISPGFTAGESSISWLGPRIASQGFVVITFNTQGRLDQPFQRGDQLLAALDHVATKSSAAVQRVADNSRQAVMGHSMGGGGALEAAKKRRTIKATVPLTPWNLDKTWSEVTAPTLIIGAQNDMIAPHQSHAEPFYSGLPWGTPKAYLELAGASHFAPNMENTTIAWSSIAWLKTYLDGDQRYKKFVCPGPRLSLQVGKYQTNCG